MCSLCANGTSVSLSGNQCVVCNAVPGCATCSSTNVCASCQAGYYINTTSNTCTTCEYPCQTCVAGTSTCATCAAPYATVPGTNGICYTCGVQSCVACSQNDPGTCTQCKTSYRLNNGQCQIICANNLCVTCNDPAVCTACVPGYAPQGNSCVQCGGAPACSTCNQANLNICLSCNTGFYLSNQQCVACASNCAQCDVNGCNTFKESTGQIAVRINGQNVPAVCDPGCLKCSNVNPSRCVTCMSGFTLQQDNTCSSCQPPCLTCSSTNSSSCLSCYSNAFLVNNTCTTCNPSSNCLNCNQTNTAQCLTCPYGYSLNSSNVCVQGCPNNCLSCASSNFCLICIEGYSPNTQGACLPCLSNCRGCSSQANAVCLNCGQGFFLNSQSVCQACAPFCFTCTSIGCSQCQAGYTLTPSFTCAANCQAPCATCSASNNAACTTCLAGYSYVASTSSCAPVTTCAGGCTVCPLNYILSGQTCIQCGNTNCSRCLSTNLALCTSCYNGFYLNNGVCTACPAGCSTCSNAQNCMSCTSGYTAQVQAIKTQTSCIACQSPCAECIGNAETCTKCMPSFTLNGWKCVSNFNFGFSIVLNTNLTNFYANYANFLSSLNSNVGSSNLNTITMASIVQGSVVVVGNLNTGASSNSNQANQQYTSLTNSLATGNSIGGMPIQSSDVTVNGGSASTPTNSGPNLALILGISIPLGVIRTYYLI